MTAGWTWRLLRCGEFRLDAGCMFGLIPRVVWMKWFAPGVIDESNRMPLQVNTLLLEGHGHLVVVEVGIGDKLTPKEQGLYGQQLRPDGRPRSVIDGIQEAGRRLEDVTAVVVTHLHFDHAGALTRLGPSGDAEKPEITFPNARIFTQKREWEDALANRSTMHRTYLKSHLNAQVAERIRLCDGESEILPGLTVFPVPGHTWGQQCIRFTDTAGRTIVYTNDVMPTALHCRPTSNLAYDVEPYTSMLQRAQLLARAADEQWTIVLDHEPGHAAYTVKRDAESPGGHRLVPAKL